MWPSPIFATLFAIPIPVDLPFHEFAIPCVPLILFSHEGLLGVVVLEELDRVELELNLFMMSAVDGTLAEGIYFWKAELVEGLKLAS